MIVLKEAVTLTVDYDDPRNWSIDPANYVNRNPRIERRHYPVVKTGKEKVRFGLIIPDRRFTTEDGLVMMSSPFRQPNLADTNTYYRECPIGKKILPFSSFCGLLHEQDGFQFTAYAHADVHGLSLFFNWMAFVRQPGSPLLVTVE